jgi:hypothetical protein
MIEVSLLTPWLTYSMEQNSSWEADGFSAGQQLPAFYEIRRYIAVFAKARNYLYPDSSPDPHNL